MSDTTISNNKRIAKNTVALYLRMLLMMAVSLYTSRVVLQVLGVVDYGIYNVVGGIITIFGFLSGAMSSTTQRFITFALGENKLDNLHRVFCTSINVHLLISVLIFVLAETIGLWFFNTKMQIPAERMEAAFWVMQCSVLTMIISVMSMPYNATIIAHEKMSAFAYISILEAGLKLGIAYLLMVISFDHLKMYAVLLLLVQLVIRLCYTIYCNKHFKETHYRLMNDSALFKGMFSFAFWSLLGNLVSVLSTQGVNMLLNVFFGPIVNTSRAIAVQIQGAITQFSTNFQMAINPQITKNYAKGSIEDMKNLIYYSSKFSASLLILLAIPVMIETKQILSVWLGVVPDHSISFVRLVLLISVFDSTAGALMIANQATGRVKMYQLVTSSIIFLIVPISYVVLKMNSIPEYVFIVHFIIAVLAQCSRLYFMRRYIGISIRKYVFSIYLPLLLATAVMLIAPMIVYNNMVLGFSRLAIVTFLSLVSGPICLYYIALQKQEREYIRIMYHHIKDRITNGKS